MVHFLIKRPNKKYTILGGLGRWPAKEDVFISYGRNAKREEAIRRLKWAASVIELEDWSEPLTDVGKMIAPELAQQGGEREAYKVLIWLREELDHCGMPYDLSDTEIRLGLFVAETPKGFTFQDSSPSRHEFFRGCG